MKLQTLTTILRVAVTGQQAVRCAPLVAGLLAGFQAQAAPPLYAVSPYSTDSRTGFLATNNNWQAIANGTAGEAYLYTPSWRFDLSSFVRGKPFLPANSVTLSTVSSAINDSGQVAGYFAFSTTNGAHFGHAFLFSGGAMTDLNSLAPSAVNSIAYGLNNSGQVVGTYSTSNKSYAFLYSNGTLSTLDFSSVPMTFTPAAINKHSVIAGTCDKPNETHACLVSGGTVIADLGTLSSPYDKWSNSTAINDKGQVVGTSCYLPNGSLTSLCHGFLYTPGSGMADLGTLGGNSISASGINNSGQVVGSSLLADNVTARGFLYSDGVMKNLNTLLTPNAEDWVVSSATAINDAGQISGIGGQGVDSTQGVLLTPIPSTHTCLFNWAESQYPSLFPPSAAETLATWVYAYRYYPTTKAYVGISPINTHVYYLGADGILQDVGPGSQWLSPSHCPQQSPFPGECLLNWAESNYPALFAPSGAATAGFGVYFNRNYYYTSSHPSYTVLGISSVDNHIYYTDSSGKTSDVGPLSQYLSQSGCQ